jgi:hypothetical protein
VPPLLLIAVSEDLLWLVFPEWLLPVDEEKLQPANDKVSAAKRINDFFTLFPPIVVPTYFPELVFLNNHIIRRN